MKRLDPAWYRGYTFVFWTFTVQDRRTGWLDERFHAAFREAHLHTLSRYRLLCLSYCLMPDHLHLLWAGLAAGSDQHRAASFFHKYTGRILGRQGYGWQKQAWDVVLREEDRERGALDRTAFYIAENPVRRNFVAEATAWPWSGSQAAGYPEFDWRMPDFQNRLWRVYETEVRRFQVKEA